MDSGVGIGLMDFVGNICGVFGVVIFYLYTDIVAVSDLKINIFSDNGIVAVANDEKLWPRLHAADLVGLAFFDEASEFFAI